MLWRNDGTPSDEIDLLVKFTGSISQKYVLSLRAAHTKRPALGLVQIWERLEERYGSPEMIDSELKPEAIKQRLEKTVRSGWYHCGDWSLKGKWHVLTHVFLFWSIGIGSLVCKLPYMLQEKGTSMAAQYNKKHHTLHLAILYKNKAKFATILRYSTRRNLELRIECFKTKTYWKPRISCDSKENRSSHYWEILKNRK